MQYKIAHGSLKAMVPGLEDRGEKKTLTIPKEPLKIDVKKKARKGLFLTNTGTGVQPPEPVSFLLIVSFHLDDLIVKTHQQEGGGPLPDK